MSKKLKKGINDLATTHPKIAAWWHPTKNVGLKNKKGEDVSTPDKVVHGSDLIVWWYLPYDVPMDYPFKQLRGKHFDFEWPALIRTVTSEGYQCPFLSGRSVWKGWNDLETLYPEIASEWDCETNKGLVNKRGEDISTPDKVTIGSQYKVAWKCNICGCVWQAIIRHRTAVGTGCPECARERYFSEEKNLLEVNSDLAPEWDYAKNKGLKDGNGRDISTPNKVSAGSKQKVWWICKDCGCSWMASVLNRMKGTGCPDCNKIKYISDGKDLLTANPKLASEWDFKANRDLRDGNGRDISTPDKVSACSGLKVAWRCSICGHRWSAIISDRQNGNGCPVCAGKVVVQGRDLASTHPHVAEEWHPTLNGNLKPTDVSAGSDKRVYWICKKCGYVWSSTISNRGIGGHGCPHCAESKGEKSIHKILDNLHISYKRQYKFKDRLSPTGYPLRDDFAILDSHGNVVGTIEYNGEQHYEVVDFSNKNKERAEKQFIDMQKRDKIKSDYLKEHNIPQLIIPYWNFDKIPLVVPQFLSTLPLNIDIQSSSSALSAYPLNKI